MGVVMEMLGGVGHVEIGVRSQSLSEPTADEPFRFLLGALGLESSSSCDHTRRLLGFKADLDFFFSFSETFT